MLTYQVWIPACCITTTVHMNHIHTNYKRRNKQQPASVNIIILVVFLLHFPYPLFFRPGKQFEAQLSLLKTLPSENIYCLQIGKEIKIILCRFRTLFYLGKYLPVIDRAET